MGKNKTSHVNFVGRVAIIVEKQLTRKSVTIECSDSRTAYTMEVSAAQDVRIGDCVYAWGDLMREEASPYYHTPADGSPKSEWSFFPIDGHMILTFPQDVVDLLDRMRDDAENGGSPLDLLARNASCPPDRAGIIAWMERTRRLLELMEREPWLRPVEPTVSVPDLSDL